MEAHVSEGEAPIVPGPRASQCVIARKRHTARAGVARARGVGVARARAGLLCQVIHMPLVSGAAALCIFIEPFSRIPMRDCSPTVLTINFILGSAPNRYIFKERM